MFIHRENALKAKQHIILITLKTILIQNPIKIFTNAHQIAHFFNFFFWQGSIPPGMCAADINIYI